MVATRGKEKTSSSNKTTEENKVAENSSDQIISSDAVTVNLEEPRANAQIEHNSKEMTNVEARKGDVQFNENFDSPTVNLEGPMADAQFKDKVEVIIEEGRREECEDTGGEAGGEKVKKLDDGDENADNMAQSEQSISEDDETDDQEEILWEDDDENSEDGDEGNLFDETELNGVEAVEDDGEDDDNEEEATHEDDDEHEDGKEEATEECDERSTKEEKRIAKGNGREGKEHNNDKLEVTLKNIDKSGEKSKNTIVRSEKLKKLEAKDKPESSSKRKTEKKVQSMGMIFMCSSKTKSDCYKYRVLGLPESKKNIVEKIYKGMRLFLYDVDLKSMYGIYKAAGPGGYNIEPKAFKSQFPAQVRYTVLEDCLPLAEEKFKKVIKENYFTKKKFDCQLNSQQVRKLCQLFIVSSKAQRRKKLARIHKAEKTHYIRQERSGRQRADNKRRPASRKEPGYRDRPNKRPREVVSPAAPLHQPPPSSVPLYVYERPFDMDAYGRDPYIEIRDTFRDVRDPVLVRRDPYRSAVYPTAERRDYDRDGRDLYLERRNLHRDGIDPYIERRDSYAEARDSYAERHGRHGAGRDLYLERVDPYRDGRDVYLESRDRYIDVPVLGGRDVYREGRGGEFRDTSRREELLVHRDPPPLSLGTRPHDEVGRDSFVPYGGRTSYPELTYSAEYSSRAGLARQYRLG